MKKAGQNGVTLIELLIVIVVIAILTSIAYPVYTDQIRKVRRYDAEGALMALANIMERDMAKTPNTGYSINDISSYSDLWGSLDGYYTFTVANATAFDYTLTAAPNGPQVGDTCNALSLTQNGVKSPTSDNCWK